MQGGLLFPLLRTRNDFSMPRHDKTIEQIESETDQFLPENSNNVHCAPSARTDSGMFRCSARYTFPVDTKQLEVALGGENRFDGVSTMSFFRLTFFTLSVFLFFSTPWWLLKVGEKKRETANTPHLAQSRKRDLLQPEATFPTDIGDWLKSCSPSGRMSSSLYQTSSDNGKFYGIV